MTVQPCLHPRANHQHGTYLAFSKDHCHCDACRRAARREFKRTTYRTKTGTHSYVDAGQARHHVSKLLRSITVSQIEQRSNVHRTAIRVLLGDVPNRPQSKRITRTTEHALMAVTADICGSEESGLVDRSGTRRRMQALAAIGWPVGRVVRHLGMSTRTGWALVRDELSAPVTVATRSAVSQIYDDLSMKTPQDRQATRSRRLAAQRGWLPPLAWDDETIDDPCAHPATNFDAADDPRESKADQTLELVNLGVLDVYELARRTSSTPANIERLLDRAGHRDVWNKLTR